MPVNPEFFAGVVAAIISALVTGTISSLVTIAALRVHVHWISRTFERVERDLSRINDRHELHIDTHLHSRKSDIS